MLTALAQFVKNLPQFQGLLETLTSSEDGTISVLEAAKAIVLGTVWRELNVPMLVVTPQPEDARHLFDQLLEYWGEDSSIHHFTEFEALPFERLTPDKTTVHQRLRTLGTLVNAQRTEQPPLIVTSASGIALKTLRPEAFETDGRYRTVNKGDTVPMDSLLSHWAEMGYRMERTVEVPGAMSRRGGIVDIFPIGYDRPVRLDFWGDYVEDVRTFDPISQRSDEALNLVTITPAEELLPALVVREELDQIIGNLDFTECTETAKGRIGEEIALLMLGHHVEDSDFYRGIFNHNPILDFLPSNCLVVLDEPLEVEHSFKDLDARTAEMQQIKTKRGELPGNFPSPFLSWNEISSWLETQHTRLAVTRWSGEASTSFPFLQTTSFAGHLDSFVQDIQQRCARSERVIIVSFHGQRLREILQDYDIGAPLTEGLFKLPEPGSVVIVRGSLDEGWVAPLTQHKDPKGKVSQGQDDGSLVLFSDVEIFGTRKVNRSRRKFATPVHDLPPEILPGSFVVHVDHGVAKFTGMITMHETGEEREYLLLEYAEDDKLYVPMELSYRVGLFVGAGDHPPSLTRLGSQEWANAKSRVKKAAKEMAEELLSLYSQREASQGIAFGEDTLWQQEIEDAFPYVETPDQLTAISDVKFDMEGSKPMDRLVCGDVGYGKTEVALRAAFKAVAHGYQVAMLVPTTVLAQQQHGTFAERLGPYPINVDVLSRFRSQQEVTEVLKGLTDGSVDICIGTHRLIQKDVNFKNLGLVVIDEEHRFGVAHKERLKQMRTEVDVLTLTATPIPRTLNMALSGIRDMSPMETPPEERLPIKTYVSEDSDELLRDAILRELDRGGQAYVVHNRIFNIAHLADRINRLVPEARVVTAHGRMPEERLEQVMAEFGRAEHDVLLCTTIIESGLDLPNVNTLIIDRADTLGLAQLYQLRGRVGRGRNRAYCYLFIPPNRRITEGAQKRLETILAATELGAGFRIAMKDLEIRGAGQILGTQQSGSIRSVGFDLYSEILNTAVEELKSGEKTPDEPEGPPQEDIIVNLKIPSRIPPSYIEDLTARLSFYQRLNRIRDLQALQEIRDELWDRFGAFPHELHNLLYVIRVRVLALAVNVGSVAREGHFVAIRLTEDIGGARAALQKELGSDVRVGNHLIRLDTRNLGLPWGQVLLELLEGIAVFMQRMTDIWETQ